MSYNPTSSDNPMSKRTQPETDDHSGTEAQLLDVVAMPLKGRHLIEASAGTGKTFNITRLYLRLLLEKKTHRQRNIGDDLHQSRYRRNKGAHC